MTPHSLQIPHPDGGHFAALRWTRDSSTPRPLLVFSHATGFNAATYRPLLDAVAEYVDVLAADARGHGQSTLSAQPTHLHAWTVYYRDLAHLIAQCDRPVYLAGHSIGGLCSLAVAARKPEWVKGVMAIDPVMLDPLQGLPVRVLQWLNRSDRHPLAAGAKRRRPEFASLADAFKTYRQRKSFADWSDEWLTAYVESAFRPIASGVRLRCEPAWESRTFAMVEHWPWRFIPRVQAPVSLVLAQYGSTCSPRSRKQVSRLQPAWKVDEWAGTSHFLPMEKTSQLAECLGRFILDCNEL